MYDHRVTTAQSEKIMKNAMFQYATPNQVIEDTDLIALDEANEKFESHKEDFLRRLSNGEDPEMCIWINCESNTSYRETSKHWHHEDVKVDEDGSVWVRA